MPIPSKIRRGSAECFYYVACACATIMHQTAFRVCHYQRPCLPAQVAFSLWEKICFCEMGKRFGDANNDDEENNRKHRKVSNCEETEEIVFHDDMTSSPRAKRSYDAADRDGQENQRKHHKMADAAEANDEEASEKAEMGSEMASETDAETDTETESEAEAAEQEIDEAESERIQNEVRQQVHNEVRQRTQHMRFRAVDQARWQLKERRIHVLAPKTATPI
eukprot:TRINITY_DN3517_c0_g1_i13.p1 TRINITY_DN3517_c0_g1~~TRINITY_DN3517_c0_g1_i13.p1  ORF type:complete len:221 (-),score=31.65 TRINITY_DN3517_c0_g1_i13:206-868(-)